MFERIPARSRFCARSAKRLSPDLTTWPHMSKYTTAHCRILRPLLARAGENGWLKVTRKKSERTKKRIFLLSPMLFPNRDTFQLVIQSLENAPLSFNPPLVDLSTLLSIRLPAPYLTTVRRHRTGTILPTLLPSAGPHTFTL